MKPIKGVKWAQHSRRVQMPGSWKKAVFGRKIKYPIIMRIDRPRSPNPQGYSLAHTLANLFYPKIFPKMLATGIVGHHRRRRTGYKTTYTKKVNLTKESEEAIDKFYSGDRGWRKPDAYDKYEASIKKEAYEFANKLYRKSGIEANHIPVNVGRSTKGNLVYFEISRIQVPLALEFAQKMPEHTPMQKLRKKQALVLVEDLQKLADRNGWVKTHSTWAQLLP